MINAVRRRGMLGSVKRAVLIVNPYSTQVTGERIGAVEDVLRERIELRTEVHSAPSGHATELAASYAAETDAPCSSSRGDGTYNEALNGAGRRCAVARVPAGQGGTSVLPRSAARLAPRDPVAAVAAPVATALAEGRTRRISLGAVAGRRFCFSAGIGFDAEAVRRLNALGRAPGGARPGDIAFLRTLGKMIFERRGRWDPEIEIEGVGRAAFVLVANGDPYSYAGSLPIHVAPAARFEGGIDFAAPTRVRARDVPRLFATVFSGRGFERLAMVSGHDLDRIVVRCDRPLPLQADGEDLGDVDGAVFEAKRDAVSVLV